MKQFKLPDPQHSLAFHMHNYLSMPEAQEHLDAITAGMPDLRDAIQTNHIDKHNELMLSLGDDQPLISAPQTQQPVQSGAIPMGQPGFPNAPGYHPNDLLSKKA